MERQEYYLNIKNSTNALFSTVHISLCMRKLEVNSRYTKKNPTMEMRYFRRLLNINYIDHITNEEVKRRIRLESGQYEELLSTVKKRKLKWYGHVTRASGLSKTIMQGTVRGGRKRGGQRKKR